MIHKRAIYASDRIDEAEGAGKKLSDARKALYRSQCNCAYWHGLFGGLYLNYLRHALYHNIIDAESAVEAATEKNGPFAHAKITDLDRDGFDEAILSCRDATVIIDPQAGGSISAIDWKPKRFALINTLARRFEAYHRPKEGHAGGGDKALPSIHELGKDLGDLRGELIYDSLPRYAFLDHAFDGEPDWKSIAHNKHRDYASPCFAGFRITSSGEKGGFAHATLSATAPCSGGGELAVEKRYVLKDSGQLSLDYKLSCDGGMKPPMWFATEFCFTMLAGHDKDRYYLWNGVKEDDVLMDARRVVKDVALLEAVDRAFGFKVGIKADADMMVLAPIETVSQSEKGFDRMYQGSTVWFAWKPSWATSGKTEISVGIEIKNI